MANKNGSRLKEHHRVCRGCGYEIGLREDTIIIYLPDKIGFLSNIVYRYHLSLTCLPPEEYAKIIRHEFSNTH